MHKKRSPSAAMAVLAASIMLVSVLSLTAVTADDVPLPLYDYRRPITVTNDGDDLSDHQLLLSLDTAAEIDAGRMQSDCADIRFTDSLGLLELPFWLESGCGSDDTLIWVSTPLTSGENTIHVRFGGPKAESASDPYATFPVYDDFEHGGTDGWEAQGGAEILGVEDGALQVHTSGTKQAVLYTQGEMTRGHRLDAVLKVAPGIRDGGYVGLGFLAQDNENTYISRSTSISRIGLVEQGSYTGLIGGTLVPAGTFSLYEVWFDGDTIHTSIAGETATVTNTVYDSGQVGIASWWGLSGSHELDQIVVRSDPDIEPTASIGELQECTLNLLCE